MKYNECFTKGWHRIQWTAPVDLAQIHKEFHSVVTEWYKREGAFPSYNTKLSTSDAGTIHLHRTYGEWMRANVGDYLSAWDAHAACSCEDEVCEFHMMFSDRNKAMLFKLTFG